MLDHSTPTTLIRLYAARLAADGAKPALRYKRDSGWRVATWNELAQEIRRTAAAFVRLGVRPGDRVIHLSRNRYEWVVTDLALLVARAVHVPVHAPLAGPQVAYQILDSEARLAILSGPEQAAKLVREEEQLGHVGVVSYDACGEALSGRAIPRLCELAGNERGEDCLRLEREAIEAARPEDLATILYTSGTTGEPKGVMLSQWNLASNVLAMLSGYAPQDDELRFNWLPLSHVFARVCDLYCWMAGRGELVLGEGPDAILANCAEVRPTILTAVPYFYEKVMRHLTDNGRMPRPGELRGLLGGRLRFCCSGGAALPDHVAAFFRDQGVEICQGYGLTESSPVISMNVPGRNKLGASGELPPGIEVRIASDGEILTRGPHVMQGYWKRPEATAETIREGWLHTGDLGELDAEGYLRITGRKKELIVTAAGKNIAPVYLEALLTADALIAQAMVIGDGKNYLTALIVPNVDGLRAEMLSHGHSFDGLASAIERPDVRSWFADRITLRLADVSHYEQVCKFRLLSRPFTVESGELTPTLKLRRGVIARNHAAAIETMYGP